MVHANDKIDDIPVENNPVVHLADSGADMERGNEHATDHPGTDQDHHRHHHHRHHHHDGHGGLNETIQVQFELANLEVDNNHNNGNTSEPAAETADADAAAEPHKVNYKDYLKAQRSLKMASFRNHGGASSRNLMTHPKPTTVLENESASSARLKRTLSIHGSRQSMIQDSAAWQSFMIPKDESSAYSRQMRALSLVGSRQSMLGDSAAWKSFMIPEDGDSSEGEQGDDNGSDTDDSHPHHHHHSIATIPFYCPPVQRQRWGDDQILPHINWGSIFFDLFYVAAAYNLGVLLISAMNADDWPRGVLYFVGIFGPLYTAWENDLYYSSRYTVMDHFHRLCDVLRFLLVASAVLHIKTLEKQVDTGSVETLVVMASITLEALMTLILNVELVHYADGDRTAIVNHTRRKIKRQYLPMFLVYLTATIVTAVLFAQTKKDEESDSYSGGGGVDDDLLYNNSKLDYANDTSPTSEIYYDSYNVTEALDGGFSGLDTAEVDASTTYLSESNTWIAADIPYLISCIYYVSDSIFRAVQKVRFSHDEKVDIRDHFVPNNIDYLIHRYGEWTMLMIGESVLSLLMVEIVETLDYYIIAIGGVLTVILLQILKFESEPSHSDGHALWRSMGAAVCFSVLTQILSIGLIAFGVSYKVILTSIAYREGSDSDYGAGLTCGGSKASDSDNLRPGEGASCLVDSGGYRRLAKVPAITDEAAATLFCGSLAIVLISMECLLLTHAGIKKNYMRLFVESEHHDWRHLDFQLFFIGCAKILIILFTATISQWQTDPTIIAALGFGVVSALAISRIVSWGLVYKQEEIKRFMAYAKDRAVQNSQGAARIVGIATSRVSSAVAAASSLASSSRHADPAILLDKDRSIKDSSLDATGSTDPK